MLYIDGHKPKRTSDIYEIGVSGILIYTKPVFIRHCHDNTQIERFNNFNEAIKYLVNNGDKYKGRLRNYNIVELDELNKLEKLLIAWGDIPPNKPCDSLDDKIGE